MNNENTILDSIYSRLLRKVKKSIKEDESNDDTNKREVNYLLSLMTRTAEVMVMHTLISQAMEGDIKAVKQFFDVSRDYANLSDNENDENESDFGIENIRKQITVSESGAEDGK